jgi:hypothetical protein
LHSDPGIGTISPSAGSTSQERTAVSTLDRLYSLEIEFHRQFRLQASEAVEAWSVHTSYALQHGYEPLLRTLGPVASDALVKAKERLAGRCDPRDVQAAFHSLQQLVVR